MSVLPSTADIARPLRHVRFVPNPEVRPRDTVSGCFGCACQLLRSPDAVAKTTKFRMPRHQKLRRTRAFLGTLSLALRLWFQLFWLGLLERLGIGSLHLCKRFPNLRLGRDADIRIVDLCWNDRRDASVKKSALRPFMVNECG